jgi:hypothetical protein
MFDDERHRDWCLAANTRLRKFNWQKEKLAEVV